ncbi:hypothetical protein OB923_06855 [Bifidobacterium catenulatum subsp. kashiwanohense]|uniref:Uncharacterized protein n=1 Tax=Bifidobacterium catenulatum subsp. kashiwanohense TaxID=630129 RepID=A0AA43P8R0_9BIFI|nr:hypothetical protein [Bifidobacterium catenulatum]MDH7871622.1 hypothetical protein [Bifidobacterium catenulatum subsp. kashiwanohense]MDH7881652.1 hypothetical protein [Bifidobacterium catenulatum subsp. kashiwanohense]MDH7890559.1 hypothetical protein [Bifidobacterium catenulatum subsp. kashiwanohense]MDH7898014.1 hypothetical protein [Bifidobacterium catenulatum subsp. kashiwanohense]MDH7902109.1 hypothetical protein [Bifidobacterium catenulatum subsp. kashiwanohense]
MNPEQRNDLSTLSEESLSVKDTSISPTSKRVSIAQVLEAGLLIPGETLVRDRPRKGERWVARHSGRQAAHGCGCHWPAVIY